MTGSELVHVKQHSLAELEGIAKAFAASGYFQDATDVAKAYTKVVAGQELGIGPMQAITQIHVVKGKPTLSAGLVGALIKRSGRYNYRVRTLTDTECTLVFVEGGEDVGDSSFTLEDAKRAGLTNNPTWRNYPRNMLLSRALTNGARWYCPDVFGGAIYTPDELGEVVDGDTGEIVAVEDLGGESEVLALGAAPDAVVEAEVEVPPSSLPVEAASLPTENNQEPDAGLISEAQRRRIFAIGKENGLSRDEIADVVQRVTGQASTRSIPRDRYETVCGALEFKAVEA